MEERLNRTEVAVKALQSAIENFESRKEDIAMLNNYLGSDAWHSDRDDDRAGLLPDNLRRGVLSEDAIWNLLESVRELRHTVF